MLSSIRPVPTQGANCHKSASGGTARGSALRRRACELCESPSAAFAIPFRRLFPPRLSPQAAALRVVHKLGEGVSSRLQQDGVWGLIMKR